MGGKKLSDSEAIGLTFGRLTVVARAGVDKRNHTLWSCRCECGETVTAEMEPMRSGKKVSCGCRRHEFLRLGSIRHGASMANGDPKLKRAFGIWASMRQRCNNPRKRAYQWYGARGITVCPEWDTFEGFVSDMGTPDEGMTIERLNVNEGYSKLNCTWIPESKQCENKTTTLRVVFQGVEWCLKSLCRHLNLKYMRVYKRYRIRGWDIERALQP